LGRRMGAVLSGPRFSHTRATRGNPRLRTDADREPEHERRFCLREITPLLHDLHFGTINRERAPDSRQGVLHEFSGKGLRCGQQRRFYSRSRDVG
jgi:hypothetical protein